MLSKQDYLNYISEMERIEHRMIELYKTCGENVEDPDIRQTCSTLREAEEDHDNLIEKLKAIILK